MNDNRQCFNCGQFGHISAICQAPRSAAGSYNGNYGGVAFYRGGRGGNGGFRGRSGYRGNSRGGYGYSNNSGYNNNRNEWGANSQYGGSTNYSSAGSYGPPSVSGSGGRSGSGRPRGIGNRKPLDSFCANSIPLSTPDGKTKFRSSLWVPLCTKAENGAPVLNGYCLKVLLTKLPLLGFEKQEVKSYTERYTGQQLNSMRNGMYQRKNTMDMQDFLYEIDTIYQKILEGQLMVGEYRRDMFVNKTMDFFDDCISETKEFDNKVECNIISKEIFMEIKEAFDKANIRWPGVEAPAREFEKIWENNDKLKNSLDIAKLKKFMMLWDDALRTGDRAKGLAFWIPSKIAPCVSKPHRDNVSQRNDYVVST